MCGLTGQVGSVRTDLAEQFNQLLAHRGPDSCGAWHDEDGFCLLTSRRLAIQDLSPSGEMPMLSACGRYVVVFNGELYNFVEIRKQLEAQGKAFRSSSDTEVVVESYAHWGVEALTHFNGMFAVAIWDRQERRLFLARDRCGEKPLYYVRIRDRLMFGSEIKAFYADPGFLPSVDPESLNDYLTLGYVPWPRTLFSGVRKLPPAHYATWHEGTLEIHRYWDPTSFLSTDEKSAHLSTGDQSVRLAELFVDAVRLRLRSDVPVGMFLSGGLDSSYVAAVAAGFHRGLRALTASFDVAGSRHDESETAVNTAASLGIADVVVNCSADDGKLLPTLSWYLDEPVAENLVSTVFRLSTEARRYFTVTLSGEGADEVFYGYRYYTLEEARRRAKLVVRFLPPALLRHLNRSCPRRNVYGRSLRYLVASDPHTAFAEWARPNFGPEDVARLSPSSQPISSDSEDVFDRMRHAGQLDRPEIESGSVAPLYDLQFRMVDYILLVRDKMTMAASIELRCPFLDHRLVEVGLSQPARDKIGCRMTKLSLRRIASGTVPERVLRRRKKPFAAPIDHWLTSFTQKWLTNSELARDGLLVQHEIDRWCELSPQGRPLNPDATVALLNLELWYRVFIARSVLPEGGLVPGDFESVATWATVSRLTRPIE